ncbi:unnamed protein product [Prunus armeniaca]
MNPNSQNQKLEIKSKESHNFLLFKIGGEGLQDLKAEEKLPQGLMGGCGSGWGEVARLDQNTPTREYN